jgi:hypothetical protein
MTKGACQANGILGQVPGLSHCWHRLSMDPFTVLSIRLFERST